MQHLQQNNVLDDDNIFLATQERRLAEAGGIWEQSYYLPTKGDLYIATFRRWLSKFARGGPFGLPKTEQFEPYDWRQPELLLDRYAQHTKHCASCSKALETCRRWRPRLFGAGLFAATLGKTMLDLVLPGALLGVQWNYVTSTALIITLYLYPNPDLSINPSRQGIVGSRRRRERAAGPGLEATGGPGGGADPGTVPAATEPAGAQKDEVIR